jgi:hypothetical protein
MEDIEPRLGRFGTTARLFALVDELPRDKQLILLKGLLGERMVTHLYRLVLDLPEAQRQALMDQLLESPSDEPPVTTLTLDGDETLIRRVNRTACRLRAVCAIEGGTFEALITDISLVGMFIRTDRSFPSGRPIRISCRLPGVEKPLILSGLIQRSEPTGIGVQLKPPTPDQQKIILAFLNTPA